MLEKFVVVGGGGFQVSTMSNPTKLLLELFWVELSYVDNLANSDQDDKHKKQIQSFKLWAAHHLFALFYDFIQSW